jgi:hypothetical protein
MSIAITLTTINKPTIIENIIEDLVQNPFKDSIHVIIMGDNKSPSDNKKYCSEVNTRGVDIKIDYFDIEDQNKYFKSKYPNLYQHIPENTFARRNFADLISIEEGHQFTIRIDDDNFPINGEPFVLGHYKAMLSKQVKSISSSNGWFNTCEPLLNETSQAFYPRGYPYEKRWESSNVHVAEVVDPKIGVNAGLWFGDPDIDAITRLHKPINVTDFNRDLFGSTFLLDKKTNCPVNTQNTCYRNDILNIAFVSPFAGRYDDIICGYVINSIRRFHDYDISFGNPILFQKRNKHNLWSDLKLELNGNENIYRLISLMDDFNSPGNSLLETYNKLCRSTLPELDFAGEYLKTIFNGMIIWSEDVGSKI